MESEEEAPDQKKQTLFKAFVWPLIFTGIMWLVKITETIFEVNFAGLGIQPRTIAGLKGILFSPFIHADYLHLISNTIPFLVLGAALIYFYKSISFRAFLLIFFLTGVWVWLAGRPSYHIGASGIVYGLAFFLFLSGIFRKDRSLMAFSLLVVFLYGGIIWGILPMDTGMSWEGHLFGALSGVICAIAFKNEGPQRKRFDWEDEDDEEGENESDLTNAGDEVNPGETQIKYTVIESKKDNQADERQ